jgi:hypothetical protein
VSDVASSLPQEAMMAFAVWVTVGFFESNVSGQFNVAGLTYHNSFTCIPLGLPSHTATTGPLLLTAGTPLGIALHQVRFSRDSRRPPEKASCCHMWRSV